MKPYQRGIVLCTASGIMFGGQWPVASLALKEIDPFFFSFIRYLIAAVFFLLLLYLREGRASLSFGPKWKRLWFCGTMAFCAYNFLVFAGQKMLGASGAVICSVMMSLIPMAAILLLWLLKGKRPHPFTLMCVVFSFVGVFLVISKGDAHALSIGSAAFVPMLLLLGSVVAWVLYTMGASDFIDWSSLRYTSLSCVLGNLSSLIVIAIMVSLHIIGVPELAAVWSLKWEFLYMALIAGVAGVYTWTGGNVLLGTMNGSLFINLVPVVACAVAGIWGYQFQASEIIGAGIVICSLVANNLYQRRV